MTLIGSPAYFTHAELITASALWVSRDLRSRLGSKGSSRLSTATLHSRDRLHAARMLSLTPPGRTGAEVRNSSRACASAPPTRVFRCLPAAVGPSAGGRRTSAKGRCLLGSPSRFVRGEQHRRGGDSPDASPLVK